MSDKNFIKSSLIICIKKHIDVFTINELGLIKYYLRHDNFERVKDLLFENEALQTIGFTEHEYNTFFK